jgi:hypothetical protein
MMKIRLGVEMNIDWWVASRPGDKIPPGASVVTRGLNALDGAPESMTTRRVGRGLGLARQLMEALT